MWDDKLFEIGSRDLSASRVTPKRVNHKRMEAKRFVNSYKLRYGCSRCGSNGNPAALDFHHIVPSSKLYNVSEMVARGMPLENIWDEMRKCIVLCANCHRIVESENLTK